MHQSRPHVLIHENVPSFPESLMFFFFSSLYDIQHSVFSPVSCSLFPVRRDRKYMILTLRGTASLGTPLALLSTTLAPSVRERLTAADLFIAKVPAASTSLNERETDWLAKYQDKYPTRQVFDLAQDRP